MSNLFNSERVESRKDKGVSPVIGVILMVAITVILAAVIGTFMLDLAGNQSAPAQASVEFNAQEDGLHVQLTANQNAEKVKLLVNGSDTEKTLTTVGETATIVLSESDTLTAVGVNNGNETTLRTYTADKTLGSVGSTTTGMVSYNPPAEGVTVTSLDSSNNEVDTAVTGDDGSFSITTVEDGSLQVNGYDVSDTALDDNDIELDSSDVDTPEDHNVAEMLMDKDGSAYKIDSASDLQAMKTDRDASYVLTGDINAEHTSTWNGGSGFNPVGDSSNNFTGSLDGNGYEVSYLTIGRSSEDYVGLIGYMSGSSASVKNIGVVNANINGGYQVGGLVGSNNTGGSVSNSYATGSVDSSSNVVGGLVGRNIGSIENSYATGSVNGGNWIGGLVGRNTGNISNSYATGSVSGDDTVGGLVGDHTGGSVTNSYATGSVSGTTDVGGLIGYNYASMSGSYWESSTMGDATAGIGTDNNDSGTTNNTGLTTNQMQSDATNTMSAFDFTSVWSTGTDSEYPYLQWESS